MGFFVGLILGIAVGLALIVGFVRCENARSKRRSALATIIAAFAKMTVADSKKILTPEYYPSWVVFSQRQKLTWLNLHLTKIWPYVNEVLFSAYDLSFFGFFFFNVFSESDFTMNSACVGSVWADKVFGWAGSGTISTGYIVLAQIFQVHSRYCGTTVYRLLNYLYYAMRLLFLMSFHLCFCRACNSDITLLSFELTLLITLG